MNYQALTTLVTALALASVPALAAGPQGPDADPSSRLTMKQCMALEAAKHDGSREADMKKACEWTTDEKGPDSMSGAEKPRAVDSVPYGSPPAVESPPPH
jgi:hypothetical protein